jgi:hypothetical protein
MKQGEHLFAARQLEQQRRYSHRPFSANTISANRFKTAQYLNTLGPVWVRFQEVSLKNGFYDLNRPGLRRRC